MWSAAAVILLAKRNLADTVLEAAGGDLLV